MNTSQPGDRVPEGASPAGAAATRPRVVVLPVRDVDGAKAAYEDLGWRLDAEFADDGYRVVQFAPPGSNTSIILVVGLASEQVGSMVPVTAWEIEAPEIAWFWWLTASSSPR